MAFTCNFLVYFSARPQFMCTVVYTCLCVPKAASHQIPRRMSLICNWLWPLFLGCPCRSILAHMDTAAPKLLQLQLILSLNMMEQEGETAKSGYYFWVYPNPRLGCTDPKPSQVPFFPLAIGRMEWILLTEETELLFIS